MKIPRDVFGNRINGQDEYMLRMTGRGLWLTPWGEYSEDPDEAAVLMGFDARRTVERDSNLEVVPCETYERSREHLFSRNPPENPTPGEWTAVKTLNDMGTPHEEEVWDVEAVQGDTTVSVAECGSTKHPSSMADAYLISASKEFRKALEMLMADEGGEPRKRDPGSVRTWNYARAAIAKSMGRGRRRR